MTNKFLEKIASKQALIEKLTPYVAGGVVGGSTGSVLSNKDDKDKKHAVGIATGAVVGGLLGHGATKAYRAGIMHKMIKKPDFSKANLDKIRDKASLSTMAGYISGGVAGGAIGSKLVDKTKSKHKK
jgi:outer membrane lipoprotein SlyB